MTGSVRLPFYFVKVNFRKVFIELYNDNNKLETIVPRYGTTDEGERGLTEKENRMGCYATIWMNIFRKMRWRGEEEHGAHWSFDRYHRLYCSY
ncbi:hypothetical protein [Geobacillus subterraneus]|uniref:hypothetical protein n=1 Tax=Geobacillus subterraneus TaxID=129338 RepID=UPI001619BB05